MDISFSPYLFENNLSTFRGELLLMGITYGARTLVFQDLNKKISTFFNFKISSVELEFKKEELISIWLYLEKYPIPENEKVPLGKVIQTFETHFNKRPLILVYNIHHQSGEQLLYTWKHKTETFAIGTNKTRAESFLFYSKKRVSYYQLK